MTVYDVVRDLVIEDGCCISNKARMTYNISTSRLDNIEFEESFEQMMLGVESLDWECVDYSATINRRNNVKPEVTKIIFEIEFETMKD